MLSANFKPKRTAAASRGFLATARLSCYLGHVNFGKEGQLNENQKWSHDKQKNHIGSISA